MRTLLAASILAASSAVLLSACSSPEQNDSTPGSESEDTRSTSEALARRGVDTAPRGGGLIIVDPVPDAGGPKGSSGGLVWNGGAVFAPPTCIGTQVRYDVRRKSRTCEDLPGAYVDANGATLVPGTGGRFRVGRLLEGTSAPDVFKAKACIYTWEPDACAGPDKGKLLIEAEEDLQERSSDCITNPASCGIKPASPSPYRVPHVIPNGPGRCEVCGFATNRSLWAVLPQNWSGFSYKLASDTTSHYVYNDRPASLVQSTDQSIGVEITLPADVADQDVEIFPAFQ
ncbi:MAG: hypothetical protein JWP87_2692 [Labilithrix sp.]|nr:hypothetical protein [Labilithrix sp.]